jgi:hypothetical protein
MWEVNAYLAIISMKIRDNIEDAWNVVEALPSFEYACFGTKILLAMDPALARGWAPSAACRPDEGIPGRN